MNLEDNVLRKSGFSFSIPSTTEEVSIPSNTTTATTLPFPKPATFPIPTTALALSSNSNNYTFTFSEPTSTLSNAKTTSTLSDPAAKFSYEPEKPCSGFSNTTTATTLPFPKPATFPIPTTALALSSNSNNYTFTFSKPAFTLASAKTTSTLSDPAAKLSYDPEKTFSGFSNSASTFANADTQSTNFRFGTARAVGRQKSKIFPSSPSTASVYNAKFDLSLSTESSTQTETDICANNLLQGLKEILLNSKHSDFVLNVKGEEFNVHKVILAANSPVFAAMIEHDTKEKATGVADIEDFEAVFFSDFLNFLYAGKVENLDSDNVFDLYEMADKYQVSELNSVCLNYMINNISTENFCEILTLGLRYLVKELIEVATQFFLKNPKEIAMTAKWGTFLAKNPVAGNELFLKVLDMKKL